MSVSKRGFKSFAQSVFSFFFSLRNCSMFTQLSTHIHSHTKRIKKSNISVQCLAKFSPVRKVPTSYRVDGQSCCFWVHASMESNYFFFNSVHKTLLNNEKRAWFNGSMHQKTSIIYRVSHIETCFLNCLWEVKGSMILLNHGA